MTQLLMDFGRINAQMVWSKAFVFVDINLKSTVHRNGAMKTNFVMNLKFGSSILNAEPRVVS